jgi:hypothetical protein
MKRLALVAQRVHSTCGLVLSSGILFLLWTVPVCGAGLAGLRDEVLQKEAAGDLSGAQTLLEQEAGTPQGSEALAEFLDRHHSADSRQAYLRWASAESDPARKRLALRQILFDDFSAGRTADLKADLEQYRAAGGNEFALPGSSVKPTPYSVVLIPGPLSSFARMAALAPDLAPEELLSALARNVVTNGFEASGNELLQPTEYLRLLTRYIGQARELQALTNKDRKIVIPNCDSSQTGDLLKILGYRMRGTCGADIVLETVNATRAFLTVDSAFPLTQLEQDLRANHPFELAYAPTPVPVLYDSQYWLSASGRNGSDFLDAFLSDPLLCRLYLGLSHLDRATAEALRKQAPAARLRVFANVLDFYGGMFQIRNGAAVTPGSPKVWASLTGASPSNPGAFFEKLISTDDGWLASYFDALSRIDGPAAAYLTTPEHLKRFYDALRGKITSPGPARPVFRSSTELMLLTSSLHIDANGEPHVPGNLDVWRTLFIKHPHGKYDGRLTRSANSWKTSDDLLEALFGLSRKTVENEPLRIFLALNDIDRNRARPLSPPVVSRLVNAFRLYGAQYVVFADAPALSEASITHYMDLFGQTMNTHNMLVRADTLGILQSLVELWRILCREDAIPAAKQDASFAKLIEPFAASPGESELFDAGRSGVSVLLNATQTSPEGTQQGRLVELMVGRIEHERDGLTSPAEKFLRIFDAQALAPLDSLFTLADHLSGKSPDTKALKAVTQQLNRLDEAQSVRSSLSSQEKNFYSVGYWSERHVEQEVKLDLESFGRGGEKKDPRAALAPLLRDTLVGLVYCYYAPPGAQVLLTNAIFVRSHDFIGPEGLPAEWRSTEVAGTGWPANSGGRLIGSLVSLPYAIAEAEQNFLTPKREQALIWADLVPQMIVDVTVNRWRNVTPAQLRWVALHLQRGRDLLAAAALDPAVAPQVLDSMRRFESPGRVEVTADHLRAGECPRAMNEVPTSVLYALAEDPSLKSVAPDVASEEIALLASPDESNLAPQAISRAFGTPKPTLTHSYRPGLLYLRPFPTLMGYSSRILAESWESNNLYFAGLADEAGIPVRQLDAYVPEWNRSAIENIFATHLEDWPAILRSLQAVGREVRERQNVSALMIKSENQ